MSATNNNNENVGIAFALVIGAGAATGIGASVVFFPSLVRLASRKTLAGALGLSAGVMTYVSFVEIFKKSTTAFVNAGHGNDKASILASACFFAGVVFMMLLNSLVTLFLGGHHHHGHHHSNEIVNDTDPVSTETASQQPGQRQQRDTGTGSSSGGTDRKKKKKNTTTTLDDVAADAVCPCHAEDPAGNLLKIQNMADSIIRRQNPCPDPDCAEDARCLDCLEENSEGRSGGEDNINDSPTTMDAEVPNTTPMDDQQDRDSDDDDDNDNGNNNDSKAEKEKQEKLMSMSIKTALAIALHNFPEGLATFVAALADPKVGLVLAVAIAIHNIPEGLCVAMPIYYATGNKLKAFGWACFSGLTEPIAALLGWAVLANHFSENMYGSMFGMVAGMMVIISVRELLPTAHRYDTEDSVVTYSFIGGMAVMAISLILFLL